MIEEASAHSSLVGEAPAGISVTEKMGLSPEPLDPPCKPDESETLDLLEEQEVKGILEAILYVSHEPLSLEKITQVMGLPKLTVHNAMQSLQHNYDEEGRGLRIVEIAGGFQMVTRPDCAPWIKRLQKVKASPKVSRSALETLAIIAYKQPIVRAEIEQIRGVETSGVLRTLLEQKLVRIVGRQDVPGRPILYGTSKEFLQRFGLRDLRDLPPLREFKELGDPEATGLFDTPDSIDMTPVEPIPSEVSPEDEPSVIPSSDTMKVSESS